MTKHIFVVIHLHSGLVYECSGYTNDALAEERARELQKEYPKDWEEGYVHVFHLTLQHKDKNHETTTDSSIH